MIKSWLVRWVKKKTEKKDREILKREHRADYGFYVSHHHHWIDRIYAVRVCIVPSSSHPHTSKPSKLSQPITKVIPLIAINSKTLHFLPPENSFRCPNQAPLFSLVLIDTRASNLGFYIGKEDTSCWKKKKSFSTPNFELQKTLVSVCCSQSVVWFFNLFELCCWGLCSAGSYAGFIQVCCGSWIWSSRSPILVSALGVLGFDQLLRLNSASSDLVGQWELWCSPHCNLGPFAGFEIQIAQRGLLMKW